MENFNRAELKISAKNMIKGKVFTLFVIELIYIAICGGIGAIPYVGWVISLVFSVLIFGLAVFYLNFIDNGKTEYGDIFYTFKFKNINTYFEHLGTLIVEGLLILLWTLLFIVPGIIKAFAYSQVVYIRAENPEKDIMECLKESETLMKGHKWEFFVLQLSFIGWFLLGGITFGLTLIYVMPYFSTTMAMYYRRLKPAAIIEEIPSTEM